MNGLWKKRVPALLLALVMIVSLMPAALAVEPNEGEDSPAPTTEEGGNGGGETGGGETGGSGTETPHVHSYEQIHNKNEHWMQCSCGDIQSKEPHTKTNSLQTIDPTCYEMGTTEYTCTCRYTWTEKNVPATGKHNFGGDYLADGTSHWQKCQTSGCTDTSPKETHQPDGNGIPHEPTCLSEGYISYTCTVCEKEYTQKTAEKAAHKDEDNDGKCDVCKTAVEHTHVLGSWEKNATMHWHTCSVCKSKVDESAHNYNLNDNTTCLCGAVKPADTVVVRFYNGGTVHNTQNVAKGGKPQAPANPSKSGYIFRGWVTSDPGSTLWTNATSTVNPASVAVSTATNYYAIYSVSATVSSVTIDATTNIGGTLATQINSRCATYSLTPALVRFTLSDSKYGTLYSDANQRYAVVANTDYSYSGVYNMTYKADRSSGYVLGYTAYDATKSNSVSGTIVIGSTSQANKISYTVAPGRSKTFSTADFLSAYRSVAGNGTTLYYVTFSAPNNYSDYGAMGSGSRTFTQRNLSDYDFYYSNKNYGDFSLDTAFFQAGSNAKAGTVTLDFNAYGNGGNVSGTVEITVSGTTKGDVTYNVDPGKEVSFDSRDFNKAFQAKYGSSNRTLSYVVFTAPTSYSSFRGTVRVGSSSFDRSDLNSAYFYYNSKDATGRDDYALDRMSFRADSNAKDGDSITIPFRAYYSSSSYEDCDLVINIGKGTANGDINYDVAPGKSVDFKAKDFRNYYEDNASGTFSYVEFDQPSSSAFSNGTLYHKYGTSSAKSFTRTTIDDEKFYYSPGSKDYGIGDLTFVATNSFKDTITLDFTAYGTNGRSVSGTVTVASTESSSDGDITYSVAPGKSVDLQRTAFNTYFRKQYNSTVSYVVFERPSSTTIFNNGTLYCDYGTSSQTSFTRSNLSGTRFYYNKSDMGRDDYYLDELTFVAGTGFKDSIKLNFTAYGDRDDDYVDGTLVIKADGAAAITSNYTGGIRYTTTTGVNVQINANDVARYFRKFYPSYNLQYVTLGGVPAAGSLYYNYYNASSYGTTTRTQITSANYAGTSFYLSPTSTAQYALTELTYVPSGTSYCAGIPFTAYGSGGSVTGSILISVSRTAVSEVYGVTPRNTAVNFPASSIYSAVLSATGSALSGIQLLELPAATTGAVYIGTGSDRANTSTVYTYAAGANQMALLRFVPTAAFTGSVTIPYVALDANGNALATGTFSLGVLNNRKTLKDVPSSEWCYKYVMELTDQNVISGYTDGSFKPNSTVTYGAALKLIMLAAGYPEQAPTGKNVFSGYLSKAQADGIVTRSNVNLTAPITRLQVAQLAAGALKLNTSNLSSVKPFTDTSDVYVQALNAAGIVEGYFSNGTSTFRPSNTLTRGQMSAIVWRMNQYRK